MCLRYLTIEKVSPATNSSAELRQLAILYVVKFLDFLSAWFFGHVFWDDSIEAGCRVTMWATVAVLREMF